MEAPWDDALNLKEFIADLYIPVMVGGCADCKPVVESFHRTKRILCRVTARNPLNFVTTAGSYHGHLVVAMAIYQLLNEVVQNLVASTGWSDRDQQDSLTAFQIKLHRNPLITRHHQEGDRFERSEPLQNLTLMGRQFNP
jgi:hypothetical protein